MLDGVLTDAAELEHIVDRAAILQVCFSMFMDFPLSSKRHVGS